MSLRATLAELSAERRAMRAQGLSARYVIWWQTTLDANPKHLQTLRASVKRRDIRETIALNQRLFEVQRERCYLCGHRMSKPVKRLGDTVPVGYTRDHVHPQSKGGRDAQNILLAHGPCNVRKGNRLPHPCELIYLEGVNLRLHTQERRAKR